MTLNRFLSMIILAGMAAMIWWLEDVVQTSQQAAMRKENNRPDIYMEGFTMRQYKSDGSLSYRATGDSLIRYPKEETLDIKQLDMVSTKPGKPETKIKADQANIAEDGDQIFLTGNVVIHEEQTDDGDFSLINTEKLFIDTTRDYMETDVPISIKTSKHHVTGTGLQAWSEYKKVRLLSKVKGIHEP